MSFSSDLTRFMSKAQVEADKACRKIALEVFRGVILKTPVDTGRARGNWQIGVAVVSGTLERDDKNGSAALGDVVQALRPGVFDKEGQLVLTNNLPYIRNLEFGSSSQSPQGMVRLSIAEIVAKYGR